MSEYTPTTAEVRGAWSAWYEPGDDRWMPERFDRWLAAHDREVAAKALEDAARAARIREGEQ